MQDKIVGDNIIEISACEVCKNHTLESVLNLGSHPMCDDLVPVADTHTCTEYPIEILFCEQCITAHQRFQVPKRELFPDTYHYRSRFTADVLNGMQQLVRDCAVKLGGLNDKQVLDVGCNDGSLLDFFQAAGASTLGIEPTGAHADAKGRGHVIFDDYLNPEVASRIAREHGKPDLIVFTAVFAHIENLEEVLDSLRNLISDTTVLVIKNHYLGGVLESNQFDTFYHEHPRTYSCTTVNRRGTLDSRIKVLAQLCHAVETEAESMPGFYSRVIDLWELFEQSPGLEKASNTARPAA